MEVIETTVATTIVERYVSHGGLRLSSGTYRIAPGADGGAKVTYEYAWDRAPRAEQLAAPLVRALMRRELQASLERLGEILAQDGQASRSRA
jgi:hypothetical protein